MKKTSWLIITLSLILIGAGCARGDQSATAPVINDAGELLTDVESITPTSAPETTTLTSGASDAPVVSPDAKSLDERALQLQNLFQGL